MPASNRTSLRSRREAGIPLVICLVGRSTRASDHPDFFDIERGQNGECAVGILRQTPIAKFRKTPKALERQEGMFDFGTDTVFALIGRLDWPPPSSI